MDLQEAFDAGFLAVKAYVDDTLSAHEKALPDLIRAAVAEAVAAIPPARDGDSVDPDAVKAMVDEAVAALPKPQDGKDLTAADALPLIESEVAKAVAALPPAAAGKDADPDVVRAIVAEAVAALPPARDGKDADPEAIREMIDAAVAEQANAFRPDTEAQERRWEEADAAALETETRLREYGIRLEALGQIDVSACVDAAVKSAVANLPPPVDGKSVTAEDVAPLIEGAVQRAVAALPAAKDGVGLAGALIDKDGGLVVTLTNGDMRDLGKVVGRDGVDAKGEPGRDAVALTGFDATLSEDGRVLKLSLESDEVRIEHSLQLPVMIYRGVFKEGQAYGIGDTVTWAGSLWHCSAPTADKPGEGSADWTLAAKRGRDGKDWGKP